MAFQIVGIGLAIFAIIYISGGKKDSSEPGIIAEGGQDNASKGNRHMILLFAAFVGGGCMDMMSKLFDEFGQDSCKKERFVFYGFVISSVIALVLCLVKNRHVTPKDMLMGVMLGVPNQLTILFQLKAVGELPAYLVPAILQRRSDSGCKRGQRNHVGEVLSKREYIATGIMALELMTNI